MDESYQTRKNVEVQIDLRSIQIVDSFAVIPHSGLSGQYVLYHIRFKNLKQKTCKLRFILQQYPGIRAFTVIFTLLFLALGPSGTGSCDAKKSTNTILLYVTCSIHDVVCGVQHVVCSVWCVVCGVQHVVCGVQHVVCGVQHVVCNVQ